MAKPQNPLWQTTKTERKSYYSYFFGQNMIYNMISAYLATFLILIGVNPVKSAIVMLIVKVWDAVNDAIFGVVFDCDGDMDCRGEAILDFLYCVCGGVRRCRAHLLF